MLPYPSKYMGRRQAPALATRSSSPVDSTSLCSPARLFALSSNRGTAWRVGKAHIWSRKMEVCTQPLCDLRQVILPTGSYIHFTNINGGPTACFVCIYALRTCHRSRPNVPNLVTFRLNMRRLPKKICIFSVLKWDTQYLPFKVRVSTQSDAEVETLGSTSCQHPLQGPWAQ